MYPVSHAARLFTAVQRVHSIVVCSATGTCTAMLGYGTGSSCCDDICGCAMCVTYCCENIHHCATRITLVDGQEATLLAVVQANNDVLIVI